MCLFNVDRDDGLLLHVVERYGPVFYAGEIDLVEINAADCAVVHRAVVNNPVCHVGCRGPLCGTRDIGGSFVLGKFNPDGDIKIV